MKKCRMKYAYFLLREERVAYPGFHPHNKNIEILSLDEMQRLENIPVPLASFPLFSTHFHFDK